MFSLLLLESIAGVISRDHGTIVGISDDVS